MVPVVVFLVFFTRGETEDAWVVFPAGLGVFAAGVLMRIWAQVHLHYRLKIHKILTTTGPYAYMRNPIYAGNAAMFVGLCVMSELVWLAPVVLVWCGSAGPGGSCGPALRPSSTASSCRYPSP